MTIFVVLNAILSFVTALVAYIMIGVCGVMAIIAIYYSFIKRFSRLSAFSKVFKKIKKREAQGLSLCEDERKVLHTICDMEMNPVSFKESLFLSGKDYKRIFIISFILFLIMFVPIVGAIFWGVIQHLNETNAQQAMQQFIHNHPGWFVIYSFMATLMAVVWVCLAFSLPVILIFYTFLNQRVRKMIKKLEQFASTTAKPINL
ncbi:hypothetical protein MEI_00931 [Bartonella vinsonii subsp. arupensis Pm136co]|uniref:Uncharacterized protein n=1 Tax=Bartonella vinsonii subsp. arupensis Pm136co TaxID=1094561 RepID=A0ABN0GQ18_BARVI|nr:hypothetical protein [Bartonella vinsonii]EJF98071.1 hypothetical protein MEI_00931 [Bartonella vinsonii subsp. arupensis Pm136co]